MVIPDGVTVYVADWYVDQVTILDAATGAAGPAIATGRSPSGLAVTPDGALLIVANRLDNTVSVVDLATPHAVTVISVGEHPTSLRSRATAASSPMNEAAHSPPSI